MDALAADARNDDGLEDLMALIGRLFVILFAFLAACLVAGMIVVGAVLYPEFSDLGNGPIDQSALNVVLGFGFIFISRLCAAAGADRGADHRSVLYPERAGLRGRRRAGRAACYLGLIPFDPETLQLRRHRPPPSRNHDRRRASSPASSTG